MNCISCGGQARVLPLPHATNSIFSDGRLHGEPLRKARCTDCGIVINTAGRDINFVRDIYNDEYDLAVNTSTEDVARSKAYAELVLRTFSSRPPQRVLEVGCGAGFVLKTLEDNWTNTDFMGCEAAPSVARTAQRNIPSVEVIEGFVEDVRMPASDASFDLIFSINVFEHAADPLRFLQASAELLADGGMIIIVCPKAHPPNLELLFQDHIYTYTPCSMAHLASKARLFLNKHCSELAGIGDFQLFVLSDEGSESNFQNDLGASYGEIEDYLKAWQQLDNSLMNRVTTAQSRPHSIGLPARTVVFGAGEIAALLRAYTPEVWKSVESLIVDELDGVRSFALPVVTTSTANLGPSDVVIIATHPRSQASISERLKTLGAVPVYFYDLLPNQI